MSPLPWATTAMSAPTTNSYMNTEKEPKEIEAWEGKESNIPESQNMNLTKLKQIADADAIDQEDKNSSSKNNKYMELKFKCQQCSYDCQNNVTLQKYANTKHVGMVTGSKDDSIKYKCALRDDRFDTSKEYTSSHLKSFLEPAVPPIRLFPMIHMMPLKRCVVKGN